MAKTRNLLLGSIAAFSLLFPAGGAVGGAGIFDYDGSAPLDLVLGSTTASSGVVRQSLSYAASGSIRLNAYFVHPVTGGPWPLVIWSPGYGGDRHQQLPDAAAAARLGIASLLIDEAFPAKSCNAADDRRYFVLNVVSRRRAIDLAAKLPNVDSKRLAAAGFSYGASVTAALSGVDHRLSTFELQSSRGHFTGYARTFCSPLGRSGLAAYDAQLDIANAVRWVRSATHASFLLQNGARDPLSPRADVLALYHAARGTKELDWYPTDHSLNAAATADRARWLAQRLRLRSPTNASQFHRTPQVRELPQSGTAVRLAAGTTYRASLVDPTPSLTPTARGWAGVQFVSHQHSKVRYETAALFWRDPQHEIDLISGPAMTKSPAATLDSPHSRNFNFAPYDPPTPVRRWTVAGRHALYFDATAPPPGQWTVVGANPPELGIEHDNSFRMAALSVRAKTFVIVIHGPVADFKQFLPYALRLLTTLKFPPH